MSRDNVETVQRVIEAWNNKFSQELAQHYELRGGKIVRCHDFLTHAEGIEAAGLKV